MNRPIKGTFSSSLRHAFEGLGCVWMAERNMRIHLAIAILIVILSVWLQLSSIEWALVLIAIAFVLIGEMFNTVIELIIDLITLEQHPLVKRAKDIAAGAVLLAALSAAILGFIILGPRLWLKIADLIG